MIAPPTLKKLYEVAGRRLLINAEEEWSDQVVARLFSGWFLTPVPAFDSNVHSTIAIKCGSHVPAIPKGLENFDISEGATCHIDGETLYISIDESLVRISSDAVPTVSVWFKQQYEFSSTILARLISHAFSGALRRCGLFELHSAGVLPPGDERAILILGESGSGKSTLTLQLASRGWRYLSDDVLLLDNTERGIVVHSLRRFFALTADTIYALKLGNLRSAVTPRIKERLAPEDLFPASRSITARPGSIVFTAITDDSESRLRQLSPSESMTRLLKQYPWATYDKSTAKSHLKVLGDLAGQCIGYELAGGRDLLGNADRTQELLAGCELK